MRIPRPRNRDETPIDPVPFLVVALTGFLVVYAWGPLYLGVLGFSSLETAVVLTAVFIAILAAAYHRLVRSARTATVAIPPERRLSRLLYAVGIGIALVVLLTLPFLR